MGFKAGDKVLLEVKVIEVAEHLAKVEFADGVTFWYVSETLIPANRTYEQGLKDAWELAKKMVLNTYDGGIDAKELEKMFGVQDSYTIFKENDVKDVLAKVEAYKKEKEIKQWDVVEYGRNNIKILVTEINEKTFSGIKITPTDEFGKFGGVYSARNLTDCKKTNYKADLSTILAEIGKE